MTLTMMDKKAVRAEKTAWPQWLVREFEQERQDPNGCVGTELLSESDRVRVDDPAETRRTGRISSPRA